MLIIKSDYSPAAAADLQETDNINALQVLLLFSGLSKEKLDIYNFHTGQAAKAYEEALHSTHGNSKIDERYDEAKQAANKHMVRAGDILAKEGITIENKLNSPVISDHFHFISTTVYKDHDKHIAVACIERAVVDIEAKTYQDNSAGYKS